MHKAMVRAIIPFQGDDGTMIQAGREAEVELDRARRLEQAGILEVLAAVSESKTKVLEPAEAEGQEREGERLAVSG